LLLGLYLSVFDTLQLFSPQLNALEESPTSSPAKMVEIMENITQTVNFVKDHPYYPIQVEIASLIANEWSVTVLLSVFTALCATIIFGTRYLVAKFHPNLPGTEKAAIWWFVICKEVRSAIKCPR
jgi:hypothetical protein